MKLSSVLKVKKQSKQKKLLSLIFSVSGVLSLLFVLITFYGTQAGNFVMSVDYDSYKKGIVLSNSEYLEDPQPRLMTNPVYSARDMTYSWLKIEEVQETEGNYTDPDYDYVAYTFYLNNNGFETVDIIYHIRITENYKSMDKAIRVLVIEDDEETIYQKPDSHDGSVPINYSIPLQQTEKFVSDTIITRKRILNFQPGMLKKFSVVVWIEGMDPDTTDDILGGMIKLQMNFSIDGDE
ncbi:MAG: hypothetical protein A2Y45_00035 [Tenericutes bacterium GWC2_34_14]|nr:MAG: hypothetical protein A2Z84_03085 [Tenericutes bacterium GWA2_35_7]OHE29294.1 MAG: hypothetical protein A2Y45_00035 [Tenericutes bacterium GWC2_34_14]OHE34391.1 MAG: hypothetical protein A2012_07655 [Tenericutes bacterium GWE2_34_108]OHE35747.1 MAG: hypothetical protein A2Y46_02360 [Tenericutes bacterium GWF1_35_14]OHE39166.1 MAG: hypothetical protein A2Y44_07570 [Tenericutes bacterium GWF2_35_184]OHE42767.1 MAG: hypothetical protein A2221_08665 [Tenericutes bacterium RIFOXYA2_FULL_36_3